MFVFFFSFGFVSSPSDEEARYLSAWRVFQASPWNPEAARPAAGERKGCGRLSPSKKGGAGREGDEPVGATPSHCACRVLTRKNTLPVRDREPGRRVGGGEDTARQQACGESGGQVEVEGVHIVARLQRHVAEGVCVVDEVEAVVLVGHEVLQEST